MPFYINLAIVHDFIRIFNKNVIYCLPFTIITLLVIKYFFRNRTIIYQTLQLIRWIIIGYTTVSLLSYIIGIALNLGEYDIVNRATRPYWWFYWILLIGSSILPFSLINKKLSLKIWYLLFTSIIINLGAFLEFYVIIITSIHRDYLIEKETTLVYTLYPLLVFVMQGILLAFLFIAGVRLLNWLKNR